MVWLNTPNPVMSKASRDVIAVGRARNRPTDCVESTRVERAVPEAQGFGAAGCGHTMTDTNTASTIEGVVAHYADGRVLKGRTADSSGTRPTFTLIPITAADRGETLVVRLQDLKDVFFLRDFGGILTTRSGGEVPRLGLNVALPFTDGEVMVGAKLPLHHRLRISAVFLRTAGATTRRYLS